MPPPNVFAPNINFKPKAIPPPPPGFTDLGGTFTPGGFVPTRPKVTLPPDQAPFRHGRSPAQQGAKALTQGGETKLVDTGPSHSTAQRAAQTMAMQRMLNAKGAHIAVDGQWGPQTETAYQAYLQHGAQYTKQAQQSDATRDPLYQQAPTAETMHEQMLLQQEAQRRALALGNSPEARASQQYSTTKRYTPAFKGEPVAGWEGALGPNGHVIERPYYTQSYTHQSHAGEVSALNDQSKFEAMFGKQTEQDIQQTPQVASPVLTGPLEALGSALPGVGIARAAENGHLTGRSIVGEAANDLLWLGPSELAAPFKLAGGVLKAGRSGADMGEAARAAVALWRDKKLARVQNPIIRRDLAYSPDRQSFIAAIRDVPKLSGTEQHALIAVADHNAVARAAQTGEKPSVAWGKANFGKSTFHDLNPTKDEALGALAQTGDTHFQEAPLTTFPHESAWNDPKLLKQVQREAAVEVKGFPAHMKVPFVSKLHALVFDMPPKVGVNELLGKIKSAGIKGDEIKWNRFDEFLASATAKGQKSVTREEALGWLDKNYLQLEENRRFENTSTDYGTTHEFSNSDETKFGQYTLPGGREANYQEFTIRLPQDQYGDLYHYTGHFPDANIVAHARTTDRTVAGDKSLMIEEIQSDWHQAGQKEGYKVPVTEHPDYETHMKAVEQAHADVESISRRIRLIAKDAIFNHPSLPGLPEELRPHFEHGGSFENSSEESIGLNLTDVRGVQDWLDRMDTVKAELKSNPEAQAKAVMVEPHPYYPADGPGYVVEVNGRHLQGTFFDSGGVKGESEKTANQIAGNWNRVIGLRPADRIDLVESVKAIEDALREQAQARNALRNLESSASTGVAQGPFAKTWHELAFKRMLAEAVDKGYERIAWTTGRTQAERYNLANFFKRIEVSAENSSSDELYYWADEMARNSVGDMSGEDLGFTERVQEDLRDQAADGIGYPSEDEYYVHEHADGNTIPASPDDEGAILDEQAYNEAMDTYLENVDSNYDYLEEQWLSFARESMMEHERDYYMENAHEWDSAPKDGSLNVIATDHNGQTHEYSATDPGSGEENALENVIGPDLAAKYKDGQREFEGDGLIAGENAKSALGASHFYDNKLTGFVNKYLKQTGVQSTLETIGGHVGGDFYVIERAAPSDPRYVVRDERTGAEVTPRFLTIEEADRNYGRLVAQESAASGTVVHSIPVTDEVRKFVDQGIVLFQRDPLVKEIAKAQKLAPRMKGAVEKVPGEKTSLHLFATADVSTVVHELGHSVQDAIPALAGLDPETFARSFERYFMTAKAPTESLTLPFADIREGMRAVYGSPLKVPGARLTPKMKTALDTFFKTAEKEHPDIFRAVSAVHFQRGPGPSQHPVDPMLEAAAMQVTQGGMKLEDAAAMFKVDPVSLKAHIEEGGHATEQARILSNADVGSGLATTTEDARTILDRAQGETQFQEGEPEPIDDQSLANTFEPASEKTPEESLRAGMKGVPMRRSAQDKLRSDERARRAQAFEARLRQGSGIEGFRAALGELGGELPKINYGGFTELTPEALNHLVDTVRDHPHLMPYQKARLIQALDKATQGTMPTPSEQVLIEHVFGKETANGLKSIEGLPSHIQNLLAEVLNVPRSVMASFDLSAPFRQGLVIGARHPAIFFGNFPSMFKAFGSERAYQALMDEVKSRPTFPMMHQGGLAITDMEDITRREEQFYSNLAERLTGGVRSPIRMSGRAYSGFLVKTRADVFDHLIRVAEQQGHNVQNEKFLHDLSRYINAATGRGNLGALQGAAPFLNTVFFSPRLLASRVDLLFSPITYARADPFVRRQAIQSTFQLAGVAATVLGLASMLPGVTVNLDPRNADFGKIRIGNTRIDILGGFQQPFRLISQFATGTIISSTTGRRISLGAAGPGATTRQDILKRFFEGKLAPMPSIVNDWMKKQNFQGQKFSWSQEAYSHMIPLLAQDTADLYSAPEGSPNGIAAALGGYVVGAFGVGLQTYGAKNPAKAPTTKLEDEAKKAGMPGPTPTLLIDVKHQANLDSLSQQNKNNPQGRLDAFIKYYAEETGDHQYDKWIGVKLPDDAAQLGADNIRHALVGPGLSQYEAAIKASLKAQGKKP